MLESGESATDNVGIDSNQEPPSGEAQEFGSIRRLHKSSSDRIIDGVCGGIAEYLGVESSVIRLLVVAFSIFSLGGGIIFYLASMLVIPNLQAPVEDASPDKGREKPSSAWSTVTLILGIIVVIIGVSLLFGYYDIFYVNALWRNFGSLILPIVIILIGGALLFEREKGEKEPSEIHGESLHAGVETKKFARSVHERKIAGVCGGVAEYFGVDPTVVRLIYVLLVFASFGLAIILYFLCALVIPKEVNS